MEMDLEFYARSLLNHGTSEREAVERLTPHAGSREVAEAIVGEVAVAERIGDAFLRELICFEPSGVDARSSSLGCRGQGDFYLHHKLAEVIGRTGAVVDASDQDDAGALDVGQGKMVVAVDGMHSRLSHFPYLAGFHAARAALRDVAVMGTRPVALVSDIHLANDGDIQKVFDYTAGIATVGELLGVPLVSGSTLRIGGDMVLGDRLTGCVGAVGFGERLTPRREAEPGDVLLMSQGHGGGTIAATAIYNGMPVVVEETLNVSFLSTLLPMLDTELLDGVHSLTDITNGGIRGDAFEISQTAKVGIELDHSAMRGLVNPKVLDMLEKLDIDFMGVSIDALLVVCPEEAASKISEFMAGHGMSSCIVGRVTWEDGVHLEKDGRKERLEPQFRESPYTPVKRVVGVEFPVDWDGIRQKIDNAARTSCEKKERVRSWIQNGGGQAPDSEREG